MVPLYNCIKTPGAFVDALMENLFEATRYNYMNNITSQVNISKKIQTKKYLHKYFVPHAYNKQEHCSSNRVREQLGSFSTHVHMRIGILLN
jgi:hypothetical protein